MNISHSRPILYKPVIIYELETSLKMYKLLTICGVSCVCIYKTCMGGKCWIGMGQYIGHTSNVPRVSTSRLFRACRNVYER